MRNAGTISPEPSHAPNMCTANSCSSEKSKKSACFWAPPPFCNKKALLVRPRSGENEPFRGLGCRFVEQNVAHVSHSPRAADRSTVRSHTKDTHKSTLGRRVSTWDCWCTKYACHKDKLPSPVPSPSRPSTQRMKQREENDGVCIVGEHAKLANHACIIFNIACDQQRVVPRPQRGCKKGLAAAA